MSKWFEDADEIIILFRNSKTGQEAWAKLPNTREVKVDWVPEITPGEEREYYGGLLRTRDPDHVAKITYFLCAEADTISFAKDSADYHYDKGDMRGSKS